MQELMKLYWTANKGLKLGIIALYSSEIVVYKTSKKLLIGNVNLREEKYLTIKFNDIINITCEFGLFKGKRINIFLTANAFKNALDKHSKLVQYFGEKFNTENKFTFLTMSDSKDEILSFVNKASDIIRAKHRK